MASFPFESKQDFLDAIGKKFDERIQGFSNSLTKTSSSNVETTVTQSLSIEEDSNFVLKEISLVMKATYSLMLKSLELQQGAQTETWNQVNDSLEDLLALNRKDRISATQKAGEEPQAKIVGEDGGDRKLFSAGNLAKGGLLGAIGLLTALPVLSAIWLKSRGKDLPEEFENLVGNIRGAMMGLAVIPNVLMAISKAKAFDNIKTFFTNIRMAFNAPIFRGADELTKGVGRFAQFIGTVGKVFKPFFTILRPLLSLAKGIPIFGQVLTAIFALFDGFSAFFKTLREGGTLVEAIGSFFIGAIDGFINSIIDLIDLITFGLIPDSIINFFKDPLAKLTKIMSAIVNGLTSLVMIVSFPIRKMAQFFSGAFTTGINSIVDSFSGIFNAFSKLFSGDIIGFLESLGGALLNAITSLPRMVIDGLESAFPDFVSGIKDVIDNVLGWVKDKINALNPFRKKTEEEKFAEQFDKDTDREARQRFGRRARRGLSREERAEMDRQEEEFRAQRAQQKDQAIDTAQSVGIGLNAALDEYRAQTEISQSGIGSAESMVQSRRTAIAMDQDPNNFQASMRMGRITQINGQTVPEDLQSIGKLTSLIKVFQTAYDAEQARRQGPPVVINNNVVDQSSTVASQANISGGGGRSAPAVNPMVVH